MISDILLDMIAEIDKCLKATSVNSNKGVVMNHAVRTQMSGFSFARDLLMLPHLSGEDADIAAALEQCAMALKNLDETALSEDGRNSVANIRDVVGKIKGRNSRRWIEAARRLSTTEKHLLSQLIREVADTYDTECRNSHDDQICVTTPSSPCGAAAVATSPVQCAAAVAEASTATLDAETGTDWAADTFERLDAAEHIFSPGTSREIKNELVTILFQRALSASGRDRDTQLKFAREAKNVLCGASKDHGGES